MKILFHSNQLGLRGTEVALFDYAKYNEEILSNQSVIVSNRNNSLESLEKFEKRFHVELYDSIKEINNICLRNKADIFYAIKSGFKDDVVADICKSVIHAVFPIFEPHGNVYAYISHWLSRVVTGYVFPYVPHIVTLPSHGLDLRNSFNISKHATVFGYHGGTDSFNIPFVHKAVYDVAERNRNIFFIFMNIERFCNNLPNIIHLKGTYDENIKTTFINTCDAMLHARDRGETFGLSVAEFSIMNKPVFTWSQSPERNHIEILGNEGIYYNNYEELVNLLETFKVDASKNWDKYSSLFSPEKIMQKFKQVFIDM
jgi:hypothetical protein